MSRKALLPAVSLFARLAVTAVVWGSSAVHARAVSDEAIAQRRPPAQLSAFGFFDDAAAQRPAAGVVAFAPATPLFSDFAEKYRFVYLPEGTSAAYDPVEVFRFPVGAALIKTFAFPADLRRPDENVRLIETRVLLKQDDGWHAWAYRWNDEQTDATLNIVGDKVPVSLVSPDGGALSFTYSVPNKNQCKGCHEVAGAIVPIGPKARNLNAPLGDIANQLAHWSELGLLTGGPDPAQADRIPDWLDDTAPIEARARAWLDINCAHCHRRDGPASNSGLYLTWNERDRVALGIGKRPVAAGKGAGDRLFDIKPGDPDGSILIYRAESVEPGVMMPELGRTQSDPRALALLREWVRSLR